MDYLPEDISAHGEEGEKRVLSRRDFCIYASLALLGMTAEGTKLSTDEATFKQLFEQAVESGQRKVVPVSVHIPDENGLRSRIVSEIPVSPSRNTPLSIETLSPQRSVEYDLPDGTILLRLGYHGNQFFPQTAVPMDGMGSPQTLSVDGFPNYAGVSDVFLGHNIKKELESAAHSDRAVVSIPFDIPPHAKELYASYLKGLQSWIPFSQFGDALPELLATDVVSPNVLDTIEQFENQGDLTGLYNQYKKTLDTAALAAGVFALQKKYLSNTQMPRRTFFKVIGLSLAGLATGNTIEQSGHFLQQQKEKIQQTLDYLRQTPLPAEHSPRGFLGIVEYFLEQPEGSLPPMVAHMLRRDLLSVYKDRVLRTMHPGGLHESAWGAMHENQIGLYELSPQQLLSYIQTFENKHGKTLRKEFEKKQKRFPSPSYLNSAEVTSDVSLFTATGYTVERSDDTNHPYTVTSVKQYVFPELYKIFKDSLS